VGLSCTFDANRGVHETSPWFEFAPGPDAQELLKPGAA
jgi:hypothetical protein